VLINKIAKLSKKERKFLITNATKILDQKRILVINFKEDTLISDYEELIYCLKLSNGVNLIFNKFGKHESIILQMVTSLFQDKISGHF